MSKNSHASEASVISDEYQRRAFGVTPAKGSRLFTRSVQSQRQVLLPHGRLLVLRRTQPDQSLDIRRNRFGRRGYRTSATQSGRSSGRWIRKIPEAVYSRTTKVIVASTEQRKAARNCDFTFIGESSSAIGQRVGITTSVIGR